MEAAWRKDCRDEPARRNSFPPQPPLGVVGPIRLAILAVAVGLATVLVVSAIVFWPHPVDCGSGAGSMSNQFQEYGGGVYSNATVFSVAFPSQGHVAFSWSTPDGTHATFRVIDPNGATIYSETAASGSGSFGLHGGGGSTVRYGFGIGLTPANETVEYSYSCTTYS
jgi:hypothetical protein